MSLDKLYPHLQTGGATGYVLTVWVWGEGMLRFQEHITPAGSRWNGLALEPQVTGWSSDNISR